ncbi:hypothetical protein IV203_014853 [Nitzschia inconspicua]|uniref:Uncharacterized protein n=1 Tax=Nitzschia inconspicua TaxID=303405 RepID=A0A9K3LBM5_9STRA|nr:hypothetical protein IV203_014853 [Nitzschia inconspicua]
MEKSSESNRLPRRTCARKPLATDPNLELTMISDPTYGTENVTANVIQKSQSPKWDLGQVYRSTPWKSVNQQSAPAKSHNANHRTPDKPSGTNNDDNPAGSNSHGAQVNFVRLLPCWTLVLFVKLVVVPSGKRSSPSSFMGVELDAPPRNDGFYLNGQGSQIGPSRWSTGLVTEWCALQHLFESQTGTGRSGIEARLTTTKRERKVKGVIMQNEFHQGYSEGAKALGRRPGPSGGVDSWSPTCPHEKVLRGNPLRLTADAIRALDGEDWLSTILIDHLLQTTLKGCVPDHVLIGSSDCYSYFSTYNETLDKHDCADTVQTMRGGLQATICCYSRSKIILCNKLFSETAPSRTTATNAASLPLLPFGICLRARKSNSLAIRRSRGSSRAFACISHATRSFRVAFGSKARQEGIILKRGNCNLRHSVTAAKDGRCLKKRSKEVIKQLGNDVALHKHAPPTANDVIKAGVHKKKTLLSYKQCHRGVNARN